MTSRAVFDSAACAAAYDAIADEFARSRDPNVGVAYALRLAERLSPGDRMLDVGCGTGIPLTAILAERGLRVDAVDVSLRMIEHARRNVPRVNCIHADVMRWTPSGFYDGILAWDSTFHLAAGDQLQLIDRFGRMLSPGGSMLMTCGVRTGSVRSSMFGTAFEYHSPSLATIEEHLRQSGWNILFSEVDDDSDGGHAVVCAVPGGAGQEDRQ